MVLMGPHGSFLMAEPYGNTAMYPWSLILAAISMATATAASAAEPRRLHWHAVSEREPNPAVAQRQAQERLLEAAREALAQRWGSSSELAAGRLLGTLRQMPEVRWQETAEEQPTEYGLMHRYRIEVEMDPRVLESALDRLAAEVRTVWLVRLAAGGGTLAWWLLLGWLAFRLDRWTQGYRRGMIGVGVLAAGAWGTAVLWHLAMARSVMSNG